jgi:hypothetical protein
MVLKDLRRFLIAELSIRNRVPGFGCLVSGLLIACRHPPLFVSIRSRVLVDGKGLREISNRILYRLEIGCCGGDGRPRVGRIGPIRLRLVLAVAVLAASAVTF